jgi:spore maturation protein CgeB
VPIYNAHDPATHHPVGPDPRFDCDLAFLGNRLPDREERVRRFFFDAAELRPGMRFLIGGNGWEPSDVPGNVRVLGHVRTDDHNAFNCTPRAVLNISRESMARYGFSPATRVFEAAAAGATLITDRWLGIDHFFEPGREILVADDALDVVRHLDDLPATVGDAARRRAVADHTYDARADDVLGVFDALGAGS